MFYYCTLLQLRSKLQQGAKGYMMTKQDFRAIRPLRAGAQPVSLAAVYGVTANSRDMVLVNAYTEAGHQQKEQFLHDAATYLRAVGQALYGYGFRDILVRTNRGGMAVSGEVSAEIRVPGMERWLYLWIQSFPYLSLSSGRRDGILITARWREPTQISVRDGDNHSLDANLSSFDLAHRLVPIVGLEPQPDLIPEPEPKNKRRAKTHDPRSQSRDKDRSKDQPANANHISEANMEEYTTRSDQSAPVAGIKPHQFALPF